MSDGCPDSTDERDSQEAVQKLGQIADELEIGYRVEDHNPADKVTSCKRRNDIYPLRQQGDKFGQRERYTGFRFARVVSSWS